MDVQHQNPLGGIAGGVGFAVDKIGIAHSAQDRCGGRKPFFEQLLAHLLRRCFGKLLGALLLGIFDRRFDRVAQRVDDAFFACLAACSRGPADVWNIDVVKSGEQGVGLPGERIHAGPELYPVLRDAFAGVAQGNEHVRVVVVDLGLAETAPIAAGKIRQLQGQFQTVHVHIGTVGEIAKTPKVVGFHLRDGIFDRTHGGHTGRAGKRGGALQFSEEVLVQLIQFIVGAGNRDLQRRGTVGGRRQHDVRRRNQVGRAIFEFQVQAIGGQVGRIPKAGKG